MNSVNSPVLNRLILLVLCLNLICLGLLVFRAFQKPSLVSQPASATESERVVVAESPHPTAPLPNPAARPARWIGTPRSIVPAEPPVLAAGEPTAAEEPALLAPALSAPAVPLVNVGSTRGAEAPQVAGRTSDRPGLTGRVTLVGVPQPEVRILMDSTCGRLRPGPVTTRHFVVSADGGLANVLVWLRNALRASPRVEPPLLDQVGCMFEPYVLGVVANQGIRVRNSDPVLHNLHFTPRKNHELNFAQTRRGQIDEISFSRPELFVRIKCDVHPWMFAYVNVMEHPYFSITDTNGFYRIPSGIPAGHYVVGATHLKAGEQTREIDLRPGEPHILDFELAVPDNLQAQNRKNPSHE